MTTQERDILRAVRDQYGCSQRTLAKRTGFSLGAVNQALKALSADGWLDGDMRPTARAGAEFAACTPRRAIILAAGFGMRMVPINLEMPKALITVHGEVLIERQIRQLHEANITDITVVVGFMKEKFEYLIDRFGVKLVVNPHYATKNNLYSLVLAAGRIDNAYIIPCDIWCRNNPFRTDELYSWYMVSDRSDDNSDVRVNRKMELISVSSSKPGNAMLGIAYLTGETAAAVRESLTALCTGGRNEHTFWEAALYQNGRMIIPARVISAADAVEINTYEQLRELDADSDQLRSDALDAIARVFHTDTGAITNITVLKKGMTNRSFLFTCQGGTYIMRIPGEGTDQLIDRHHEAAVYEAISGRGLCDDPVYIDPVTGYKITRFLNGVRTCDADNVDDLRRCMTTLRQFHDMALKVDHTFDIFGQIDFYESLWEGAPSVYGDYAATKANVLSLRQYIEQHVEQWSLTHIDAVPDNFLFYDDGGAEGLQLTDWEYAGMQDPHVDVAMFCIYSLYDKMRVDRLIDIYFRNACPAATRAKIYCYIAACGLLWSNWCEYKSHLGVEFGEYSLQQYRYAKEYFRYASEAIEQIRS